MHNETQYQNPIVPGFAPDPSIVHVDGVFYLATSSFHLCPGLPIYASQDLKEWTHIGNAISRPEQLSLHVAGTKSVPLDTGHSMVASGGLFAPTIRYHDGVFYIVCTNAGHGGKTLRTDNFVISTTDIWSSNWSDPIPIPFKGIDPGLFFDDDGRVYFHGCFLLYRPHIYKLGKWYYLLVAEGGTFEHHMLCISRSESIWGLYEDFKGNPILTADGKDDEYIQNTGHGDLFQDANSQWWAVVLGVRNEKSCQPLGRETFLTPVEWLDGGWPVIAHPRMEFTGPVATSFSERTRNGMDAASRCIPPARVEDIFIRDPDLSRSKLPDTDNGPYTLFPSQSHLSTPTGTSTFICRRQRSLNSTATTSIDIATMGAVACQGIKADLTVYKDHMRHVSLSYDFDAREVVCHAWNASTGLDRTLTTTLQVRETTKALGLMIIATSTRYRLFARESTSGVEEEWLELGSCETRELAAREMTGPVFGTFAHTTTTESERKGITFLSLNIENQ
ncbi:GH43-C2 domain-containing protein [Fusarium sp. LHS14.1]|nr:GH43-C2 domain-containing protein [Fusarium sp. LHS14.1]